MSIAIRENIGQLPKHRLWATGVRSKVPKDKQDKLKYQRCGVGTPTVTRCKSWDHKSENDSETQESADVKIFLVAMKDLPKKEEMIQR